MERLGERTRDIRFYSNKNGDIVCLHSKWRGITHDGWRSKRGCRVIR